MEATEVDLFRDVRDSDDLVSAFKSLRDPWFLFSFNDKKRLCRQPGRRKTSRRRSRDAPPVSTNIPSPPKTQEGSMSTR